MRAAAGADYELLVSKLCVGFIEAGECAERAARSSMHSEQCCESARIVRTLVWYPIIQIAIIPKVRHCCQ